MYIKKHFRTKPLLLTLLILFTIAACKPARDVATDVTPDRTVAMILAGMQENQPDFQWFSTRFSGSVVWENRTHSIAGALHIQKNEAILVSIAPILGIEVARALITPDSVKLINRLESTYYLGDTRALSQMFNTNVDFYMLQSLFTGSDFPHFRKDQFRLTEEGNFLRLHAAARNRTTGTGASINQAIMIEPENMRIRTNIIEENSSGRALRADYKDYQRVAGRWWMPSELQILFSDNLNYSNLTMNYNRSSINEPQRMQFSVPSRYTLIPLTD